jgi:nucleotide-binding universal stress UspA family protein
VYKRIVVPLDGSELSERALPDATSQAKAFALPIHLIRVVDTHVLEQVGGSAAAFNYTMLGEMFEQETRDAEAYLAEMTRRLENDGFTVTSDVRVGPVARSILDAIQEGDMIVLASHGRSGIKRWVLGSVAEELLRHADVPVLMVKAAERET